MAFCTNCGKKLDEGEKFCTNCGAKNESAGYKEPAQESLNEISVEEEYVQPEASCETAECEKTQEASAAGKYAPPQAGKENFYALSEEEKAAARKKKNRTIVAIICAVLVVSTVLIGLISSQLVRLAKEYLNSGYEPGMSVPESTAEDVLRKNSYWYGFAEISAHSGTENYSEGVYEVWAIIGEDESGRTFFEVFDNENMENGPLLSYWVNLYSDFAEAEIGNEDAWLLDMYLIEEDEVFFSFWLENGAISIWYPYEFEDESFDITFFLREEGTDWDEENDPYLP